MLRKGPAPGNSQLGSGLELWHEGHWEGHCEGECGGRRLRGGVTGRHTWHFRAWILAQTLCEEAGFTTLLSLDWSSQNPGVLLREVETLILIVPASLDYCEA